MTDTELDAVFDALSRGQSLRSVLPDEKDRSRFYRAIRKDTARATQYALARDALTEALVDDVVQIADRTDLVPQDKQVRIQARQWYAGVTMPHKYGPKLEVQHTVQVDLAAAIAKGDQRVAELTPVRHLPTNPQAQDVDWEPVSDARPSDATSDAQPVTGADGGGSAGGSTDRGPV